MTDCIGFVINYFVGHRAYRNWGNDTAVCFKYANLLRIFVVVKAVVTTSVRTTAKQAPKELNFALLNGLTCLNSLACCSCLTWSSKLTGSNRLDSSKSLKSIERTCKIFEFLNKPKPANDIAGKKIVDHERTTSRFQNAFQGQSK